MTREEAIAILEEIKEEGWLISETNKCIAIEALDMAISALEKNESAEEWYKLLCEKWDSAENKGEWIPVSEKLPENNEDVLVYNNSDIFVAWYSEIVRSWRSVDDRFDENTPILAWQPLPEPYKAESEESE